MSDSFAANVVLLLHGEGSNGSTTFDDASPSRRTPTVGGNAQISTAQAKFGSSSIRFDGTGDYLKYTGLPAFTGDFTIECFVRPNSKVQSFPTILRCHDGTNGIWLQFDHNSDGGAKFHAGFTPSLASDIVSGVKSYGVWYHAVIVRKGTTVSLFVDGVLIGAVVLTTTFGAITVDVGHGLDVISSNGGTNCAFDGWIDEVRITTAARYQTAVEPGSAFTSDANTSLLLHGEGANGSTTATDSSSNALTLTPHVNAQISTTVAKFGSASLYFDGASGSCFTAAATALFGFGTGAFTVEGWCYPTDTTTIRGMFDLRSANNAQPLVGTRSASGQLRVYDGSTIYSAGSIPVNTWTHWAWVRSGTLNTLFVNGLVVLTFTNGGDFGSSKPLTLGTDVDTSAERWLGYQDEFRISKGVARYTADFTAPTTAFEDPPFPHVGGLNGAHFSAGTIELSSFTKLMLHMDGTNGSTSVPDTSQSVIVPTVNGTAAISTAQSKFGGASLLLPGTTGNNVTIADTAALRLGSDDFCIEGWFYYTGPTSVGFSDYDTLFMYGTNATQNINCVLADQGFGSGLIVFLNGIQINLNTNRSGLRNTWTHVAVTRVGTTFRFYVNGTLRNQFAYSTSFTNGTLRIGTWEGESGGLGPFVGNIDEFRILKGCAMYTDTTYTVPTAAFPDAMRPQIGFNGAKFGQGTVSPISVGFNGARFGTGLAIGNLVFAQDATSSHAKSTAPSGVGSTHFNQHGFRASHFGVGIRSYARTFAQKASKTHAKFSLATRVAQRSPRTFRSLGRNTSHFGVGTL